MSETDDSDDEMAIAEAFDRDIDPLAEFDGKFRELDADPLEMYIERHVEGQVTEEVLKDYRRTYRDWREHMTQYDRHPVCPSEQHVKDFIDYWKDEVGNQGGTVGSKLGNLNRAYEWMQTKPAFPHPMDFNPFEAAKSERDLSTESPKDFPQMSLEILREEIRDIDHILDRALAVMAFKTGARSSELGNIRLSEVHLSNPDVRQHYDELGSHEQLDGRPNAVFIPPDREHNKRERPTVIPLDEETRQVLVDWLLVRPDNGDPWLFMSHNGNKLAHNDIRNIWTKNWWPDWEYDEDDRYRSVVPHFARHWFTTWWRVEVDAKEEHVKYLRGDKPGGGTLRRNREAIHRYIHSYYEDIEDIYRERIFQLYL